jgi:adenosylcobinamide-phosphate synthase
VALTVPALAGATAWAAAYGLQTLGDLAYLLGGGALLKSTFSIRLLAREVISVGNSLAIGDLPTARLALRSLVSRDTSLLTSAQLASAAIESSAENVPDSVTAPLLAFALFGLPGAFVYRAINTADAMIGYRGRYEYLGKAAARLDDLASLIPSRLGALCIVIASALQPLKTSQTVVQQPLPATTTLSATATVDPAEAVQSTKVLIPSPLAGEGREKGGSQPFSSRAAWSTMLRDHPRTASPNAGWPMAAMAGALGVRLEKPGHYILNQNASDPAPEHIPLAVRLAWRAVALTVILVAGVITLRHVLII